MSASDIIAIATAAVSAAISTYAVLISRRALKHEEQQAEPNVTVAIEHEKAEPGIGWDRSETDRFYKLTVEIANNGETDEYVKSVKIEQDGQEPIDCTPRENTKLAKHGHLSPFIRAEKVQDPAASITAVVELARGLKISSKPETLNADWFEELG